MYAVKGGTDTTTNKHSSQPICSNLSGKAERGIFYRMAAQTADYAENKDGKRRLLLKVTAVSQPQTNRNFVLPHTDKPFKRL